MNLNDFREQRELSMKSADSWLSITGLFLLHEHDNEMGSCKNMPILLPSHSAPDCTGIITLNSEVVTLEIFSGVKATVNGKSIFGPIILKDDSSQDGPDIIELGTLKFWILKRDNSFYVRLRDTESENLKNFKGLLFFPPNENFRYTANFIPYASPKKIVVETAQGPSTSLDSHGTLQFIHEEVSYNLILFTENSNPQTGFLIFKDGTSGNETYGAGRFLITHKLDNMAWDLDFNFAVNPPCAYTLFATCPRAPQENTLPFKILAGEKNYTP